MLSKFFKRNAKPAAKASFEKMNKSELKNVIGGGGGDSTTTTTGGSGDVGAAKVKSHSNTNNN